MEFDFMFFLNSILFGGGLAMDAFSISVANGLNEPGMKRGRICMIAGIFAAFQTLMPLLGWFFVHTVAEQFAATQKYIPWVALVLLVYLGAKMIIEGFHHRNEETVELVAVGFGGLMVQGIATSVDALSVGFTIAGYHWFAALTESLIIGFVTFWICLGGILIGKRFGAMLSSKASVLGGVILIAIGIEIFVSSIIG